MSLKKFWFILFFIIVFSLFIPSFFNDCKAISFDIEGVNVDFGDIELEYDYFMVSTNGTYYFLWNYENAPYISRFNGRYGVYIVGNMTRYQLYLPTGKVSVWNTNYSSPGEGLNSLSLDGLKE